MERIRRGFRLLGASWEVLKADRDLLLLPLLSFVGVLLVSLSIAGIGFAAGSFDTGSGGEGVRTGPLEYVLIGLFYFGAYFVSIFFNAAVVGAATIRLEGGDPTARDGLRIARKHIGRIAAWAAIAATVGLILRSLAERSEWLGRIVISIVGAAWGAITFFVVPVILYEPVGVTDSIKRSARIFKERWGEQFVGNVSIGLALVLLAIPILLIAAALFAVSPVLGIVVGVVLIGGLAAVGSAITGIFNAALYRFATTGEAGGTFAASDLSASFRPKGRRGFLGSSAG